MRCKCCNTILPPKHRHDECADCIQVVVETLQEFGTEGTNHWSQENRIHTLEGLYEAIESHPDPQVGDDLALLEPAPDATSADLDPYEGGETARLDEDAGLNWWDAPDMGDR